MRHLSILAVLMLFSATASATQAVANADGYSAVAYFTSGLENSEPANRIDSASLGQDAIVLYVHWDNLGLRAHRTEVRIYDPDGEFVGKVRNTIGPGNGRFSTYYFYRPGPGDTPGDWTYKMYVDGRDAFEASIPVLAAD